MEIRVEGVEKCLEKGRLTVKGPKGELSREFRHPKVKIALSGDKITITPKNEGKRLKAMVGTWSAHINNMMMGVKQGWTCSLRATFSHFPMKMEIKDDVLVIKNFMGERGTRTARLLDGVKVDLNGSDVAVSGSDKEKVGQTVANIEQASIVKGYDRRVFQDGIWRLSKCKPAVEGGGE